MSRYPSKQRVKIAKESYNDFDLSNDHICTSDFFRAIPVRTLPVFPGDNVRMKVESFFRLSPLAVPTYGRVNSYNRYFFVPYRTLMDVDKWNAFINDTPLTTNSSVLSKVTTVPYTRNDTIINLFINGGPIPEYYLKPYDQGHPYQDIIYTDADNNTHSYYFTLEGRKLLQVFQSLGYGINWSVKDQTKMSLLPLLSFCKVLIDFYVPSQYEMSYQWIFNYPWANGFCNLVTIPFHEFMSYLSYDPDYFVSAWDNPLSPNDVNLMGDVTIPDIADVGGVYDYKLLASNSDSGQNLTSNVNHSPIIRSSSGAHSIVSISSYILNAVEKLQSYVTRNQLAGFRPIDRFLARFGVSLDYKQSNRSLYLGTDEFPIQISDVMSQADTSGAGLGDYAGKGIGYNRGNGIDFKADEHGMLIVVNTIVAKTGYYLGRDVTLQDGLDGPTSMFTPEFDALGVDAIRKDELVGNQANGEVVNDLINGSDLPDGVFGYTPRYSRYKVAHDKLTGDFRVFTMQNSGLDSYHLFRNVYNEFDFAQDSNSLPVHNLEFLTAEQDQFDRIFQLQGSADTADIIPDHFICIHHIECHASRPMKSLMDSFQFADDESHNKEVTMQVNGSYFN